MCRLLLAFAACLLLAAVPAMAQKLPPVSGNAYRCESGGRVTYSDVPCLGASRVDTTPTRGADQWSGQKRTGSDVRAEKLNEQTAEALKPLLGEDAKQRAARLRRFPLEPAAKQRCHRLDGEIATAEQAEARAHGAQLAPAQQRLLRLRQDYLDLRC